MTSRSHRSGRPCIGHREAPGRPIGTPTTKP
jgi:hypothetical protein